MTPTELRVELLHVDYSPIPSIGKVPPLKDWQKKITTNAEEVALWAKVYPEAKNTGLLTQKMPTLDIDIRHLEAAQAIEDLVRERFEERGSILVRIGNAPKRAVPFRTDTPFKKIAASLTALDGSTDQKIELLCDGQQLTAFGIHPDTNKPYRWHGGELGTIKREDLPDISEDEAKALVHDAVKLLCESFGYKTAATKKKANGDGSGANPEDWGDLLANVHAGHKLHETLVILAAKLVVAGMGDGAIVNLLGAVMDTSITPHDARWQERYDDIERTVETARKKYGEGAAKTDKEPPLTTFTPQLWHGKPTPRRQWCVEGLIPQANVTMLYGDGGLGKTLLAMQLQVAGALGAPWLDMQMEPIKSLGFYCEDDTDELHRRMVDISSHYDCALDKLGTVNLVDRVGEDNILVQFGKNDIGKTTGLYDELTTQALDLSVQLVVLDSLHDLFGGDEIKRTHARQFIGFLQRLALKINGAVLVCAHPSVAGMNHGTGTSGSTAWNNAVHSRLYLTGLEDKDAAADNIRVLKNVKANYGPRGNGIEITWRDGVFVRNTPSDDPYGQAAQVFLQCLNKVATEGRYASRSTNSPEYAPRIFSRMPQAKGVTKKNLEAAMQQLFAQGRIAVVNRQKPNRHYVEALEKVTQ
jgi:RecA-family ATPase